MKKTISRVIEIIWLCLAAICLIMGTVKAVQFGIKYSYMFYILAAVATAMFFLRRKIRISQSRAER